MFSGCSSEVLVVSEVSLLIIVYLSLRNERCGHTYETGRHGLALALASTHGVIVAEGGGADVLPPRQQTV